MRQGEPGHEHTPQAECPIEAPAPQGPPVSQVPVQSERTETRLFTGPPSLRHSNLNTHLQLDPC